MSKHILLVLTLLILPINAMKKQNPYIVYDIDINTVAPDSLAVTLSQKFPCIGYNEQDKLTHQSPIVKRIHSQKYLDNIDKHPSAMLSAINNNILMSLYPNRYSKTYFEPMLNNVPATLIATERVIYLKDSNRRKPHYTISCGQGYSFAGHAQGTNGDTYATIPIAAAYALNTNAIKQILVIDENLNKGPDAVEEYYNNGNGSIFYSKNNPELAAIFDGKITTHDKIQTSSLWRFLNAYNNNTDLAFYNINIDEPDIHNERKPNINVLFEKFIPTVFIFSGDKDKHQEASCSIIDYIVKAAEQTALFMKTQLSSSFFASSSDSISHDADETSSISSEGYDNFPLAFKITTNITEAKSFSGANFIYLADTITIDDNGHMEVHLHDQYPAYGQYGYHSTSSRSSDGYDDSNSELISIEDNL